MPLGLDNDLERGLQFWLRGSYFIGVVLGGVALFILAILIVVVLPALGLNALFTWLLPFTRLPMKYSGILLLALMFGIPMSIGLVALAIEKYRNRGSGDR